MQKKIRKMQKGCNIFVEFQNKYDKLGTYWVIEKNDPSQGGNIKWNESFRLKNLE